MAVRSSILFLPPDPKTGIEKRLLKPENLEIKNFEVYYYSSFTIVTKHLLKFLLEIIQS